MPSDNVRKRSVFLTLDGCRAYERLLHFSKTDGTISLWRFLYILFLDRGSISVGSTSY